MATGLSGDALVELAARSASAPEQGVLHLIATPIGHLGDLTLRAARCLVEVETLYCEDTRVTAKLLGALGARRHLISLNEHNEEARIEAVLADLDAGGSVGIASDAGTPLLSDPGARVVQAAIQAGHRVTTIPGASAALSALVLSGFPAAPSLFLGFAARKRGRLAEQLAPFARAPVTLVLFEAPGRVTSLLENLNELLGDRSVVVARELTKKHETMYRGRLSQMPELNERGEMVVVVAPPEQALALEGERLDQEILRLIEQGHRPKSIAKLLAAQADQRTVYARSVELRACSQRE